MCIEVISLIKDIVLIGAAITGAYVAIQGLGAWKKKLKGQTDYDLSRRILISLFKYRDAIDKVRHPMIWKYEMPTPSEDTSKNMSDEQIHFHGIAEAYKERWSKVETERTSLYADLLEAEVLWGSDLNKLFKVVFTLEHELFTNIRQYLESINPDNTQSKKDAVNSILGKKREVMYDDLAGNPDDYKKEIIDAIGKIEYYLKPKLGR